MGRWCSTKSNYMGGWCFRCVKGEERKLSAKKKREVLSNLAKKRQSNVFDVPRCPTISPVVGHSKSWVLCFQQQKKNFLWLFHGQKPVLGREGL